MERISWTSIGAPPNLLTRFCGGRSRPPSVACLQQGKLDCERPEYLTGRDRAGGQAGVGRARWAMCTFRRKLRLILRRRAASTVAAHLRRDLCVQQVARKEDRAFSRDLRNKRVRATPRATSCDQGRRLLEIDAPRCLFCYCDTLGGCRRGMP